LKSYFDAHSITNNQEFIELGIEDRALTPIRVSLAGIRCFYACEKELDGDSYSGVAIVYIDDVESKPYFVACRYEDFRQAHTEFIDSLQIIEFEIDKDGN
jgi:hypothetical protein